MANDIRLFVVHPKPMRYLLFFAFSLGRSGRGRVNRRRDWRLFEKDVHMARRSRRDPSTLFAAPISPRLRQLRDI